MADRHALLQAVRGVVEANVPDGFVRTRHDAGLECWAVPDDLSPRGRGGDAPLTVVGVGEGKTHLSLFLIGLWWSPEMRTSFDRAWREATGAPVRRGKVAVQLRHHDDVPLDVLAEAVRWSPSTTSSASSPDHPARLAAVRPAGTLAFTPRGGAVW